MSKAERTKGPKLKSELTRAQALVQAGKLEEAAPLLRELAPQLRGSEGWRLLLTVLESLGREEEARRALQEAARDKPGDHSLGLRAALDLHAAEDWAGAAALFDRVSPHSREDPEVRARYAHALFMAGRRSDALGQSRAAYGHKPRGVPALVHGIVALDAGDLASAGDALDHAAQSLPDPQRAQAEGMLASALFWRGETARALDLLKGLDARGALEGDLFTLLAVAAALHGDEPLARASLGRAPDPASPSALLAVARVELALGRPEAALAALEPLATVPDLPELLVPLIAATRGRALRSLGRAAEARAALEPLASAPSGALGAMALTDLGRLDGDDGLHERAAERFARALELDPSSQEAARGLTLARERTAWRTEVAARAEDQVAAARSEAEAMRRAFAQQERELAMLRARLAQSERAAGDAREEAERVREQAERARSQALREELATREAEAAQRAEEALDEAFGEARTRCPAPLLEALRVAETTYQKALYTELHPAAVGVLFAGALERGLYLLLVRPFEQSLTPEKRDALLRGAARELRPGRVEYSERFVEAFDPSRHARAPALGEIARAIGRRREPALRPFGEFLSRDLGFDDALLDALGGFVERTKEQLRDPVAHGRALELPQQELTRFRRELLFDLPGLGRGALPALVAKSG